MSLNKSEMLELVLGPERPADGRGPQADRIAVYKTRFRTHEKQVREFYETLRADILRNRHCWASRVFGLASEEVPHFKALDPNMPLVDVESTPRPFVDENDRWTDAEKLERMRRRNAAMTPEQKAKKRERMQAWRLKQKEINSMEETNNGTE